MAGARGRQAVSGDVSMVTLMVNGYYDVELGAAGWSPYLGGGLGVAFVSLDAQNAGGACRWLMTAAPCSPIRWVRGWVRVHDTRRPPGAGVFPAPKQKRPSTGKARARLAALSAFRAQQGGPAHPDPARVPCDAATPLWSKGEVAVPNSSASRAGHRVQPNHRPSASRSARASVPGCSPTHDVPPNPAILSPRVSVAATRW